MNKKKVNSYDMFDTLFARKCYEPENIFHNVENRFALEINNDINDMDFVNKRKQAEAKLYNNDFFTLEDVYRVLVEDFDISPAYASILIKYELDEEFKNLIPIKENLDKLKPNDIVISDMYLSQKFLKQFLPKYVNLIVTPNGKASGYIYDELSKIYDIETHTGDNTHSDIAIPESKNIDTKYTDAYVRTDIEERLAENGLEVLSNILRKIRLGSFNSEIKRTLELLQTNVNYPMLILMYDEIVNLCDRENISNILISGRDGEKLHRVCEILQSPGKKFSYFYTSRMSRKKASNDYLEYVKREVDNKKTLIVDLDGTGWTLRNLKFKMEDYDKKTADNISLYLFHYLDEDNLPGFMERPYQVPNYEIHSTFFTNKYQHNRLELLNLTNHPMVEDVKIIRNNIIIDFFDNGHDYDTLEYVETMDDLFLKFLPELSVHGHRILQELHSIDRDKKLYLLDIIYSSLALYPQEIFDVLERQQREEEKAVENELNKKD